MQVEQASRQEKVQTEDLLTKGWEQTNQKGSKGQTANTRSPKLRQKAKSKVTNPKDLQRQGQQKKPQGRFQKHTDRIDTG